MKECKHRWEQKWPGAYQCARCDEYIYETKMDFTITAPNAGYAFADLKPNYTISFHDKDQKRVGSFDFNEGRMIFEGDVNESGQIFVDWVVDAFKKRIDDAVKAERVACAEIARSWIKAYPHPSESIANSIMSRGK